MITADHLTTTPHTTWQRLLSDSYRKPQDLLKALELEHLDTSADILFTTRVPKAFVEKMEKGNASDPLLLQVLPQNEEFINAAGFSIDPLDEKKYNPLPGLLHKYQSRVLLTLQGACAINCRYCFRRHFDYADNRVKQSQLLAITEYITEHPEINEVILSGGDPLMTKDDQLAHIIGQLEALPQLKRVRFHTRLPVVIPERITNDFVSILSRSRLNPVVVLHCNHPNEIDDHFVQYIQKMTSKGICVLNQSVLLKEINDNVQTLVTLSEKLFEANVLPYYLFLLDKVSGVGHFDVQELEAKKLVRKVAAELPGYLVPKLTRETPGLASKNMWF